MTNETSEHSSGSSGSSDRSRPAATTVNNSSEQQERAAAASSSSEQQQRAAAAVSSSSEQQQQRAASNSSREQQQQQRAAAAIAAAVVNPTYPPVHVHPYVLSNVYSACISRMYFQMYLPYLECISENISYLSRMISQYRARHSYKKSLQSCIRTPSTSLKSKQQKTTSPLSPTGRLWDHPPLRGRSRRPAPQHKTNPPNPPTPIPSK